MNYSDKNFIKEWEKEGWKFNTSEKGFNFTIEFPFDKFKRVITVYFETEPRNYYFIEVKLKASDNNIVYENLYVEPKEHMLIHNTLLELGWI